MTLSYSGYAVNYLIDPCVRQTLEFTVNEGIDVFAHVSDWFPGNNKFLVELLPQVPSQQNPPARLPCPLACPGELNPLLLPRPYPHPAFSALWPWFHKVFSVCWSKSLHFYQISFKLYLLKPVFDFVASLVSVQISPSPWISLAQFRLAVSSPSRGHQILF